MNSAIDLTLWKHLALDLCPNCQHQGLLLEKQSPFAAILGCPKCSSRYWMSAIRPQGAYQLFWNPQEEENFLEAELIS